MWFRLTSALTNVSMCFSFEEKHVCLKAALKISYQWPISTYQYQASISAYMRVKSLFILHVSQLNHCSLLSCFTKTAEGVTISQTVCSPDTLWSCLMCAYGLKVLWFAAECEAGWMLLHKSVTWYESESLVLSARQTGHEASCSCLTPVTPQ